MKNNKVSTITKKYTTKTGKRASKGYRHTETFGTVGFDYSIKEGNVRLALISGNPDAVAATFSKMLNVSRLG